MTLEKLDAAIIDAGTTLQKVAQAQHDETEAARASIALKYKPSLFDARDKLATAEQAKRDYLDTLPPHEWEGRVVVRLQSVGGEWYRRSTVTQHGIVETVRQSSKFPDNMAAYLRPDVGEAIVRKIKKDGKPSLHIWGRLGDDWKLEE